MLKRRLAARAAAEKGKGKRNELERKKDFEKYSSWKSA
jgi:hypothetical protein